MRLGQADGSSSRTFAVRDLDEICERVERNVLKVNEAELGLGMRTVLTGIVLAVEVREHAHAAEGLLLSVARRSRWRCTNRLVVQLALLEAGFGGRRSECGQRQAEHAQDCNRRSEIDGFTPHYNDGLGMVPTGSRFHLRARAKIASFISEPG